MNRTNRNPRPFAALLLPGIAAVTAAGGPALIAGPAALAQDGGAAAAPPPSAAQPGAPAAPSTTAPTRTVANIVATMSRDSGAVILADSSVAQASVPAPKEASTAANFEQQLDDVVKALPQGSTWAKVYLPLTGSASRLNADAVTEYVLAQARLFGKVGAGAPAGTVEIMGQKVPQDKADGVIAALNLKPIYIVANPANRAAAAAAKTDWSQMTADQRRQYAQQQAQQVLSMDPQSQQQYLQQQRAVMEAMMQQMTPAQRQQLMQGMGGGFGGGRRGRGPGQ